MLCPSTWRSPPSYPRRHPRCIPSGRRHLGNPTVYEEFGFGGDHAPGAPTTFYQGVLDRTRRIRIRRIQVVRGDVNGQHYEWRVDAVICCRWVRARLEDGATTTTPCLVLVTQRRAEMPPCG